MRSRHVYSGALLAALLLVTSAIAARAEQPADVENPRTTRGAWVTDRGGVLTNAAELELNTIAGGLQRKNGAEIAVVTIHDSGERTPKQFATELFNLWHIGQKGRDNGVLVLIVVNPHRIEVETGYGAEALLPDARVGRILDRFVIPHYRDNDWDGGTIEGVRAMARVLAGEESWTDRLPTPGQALPWTALGGGAFAALAALLIRERRRTRYCSKCHRRMRLLSSEQEKAYLSEDERFEEELRSMNHMVWRCDDCQTCLIEHKIRWRSGYTGCPQCRRRTLVTHTRTLVEPTYDRSGSSEVEKICMRRGCGYKRVERETIPRRVYSESSSSGSSSSFSGGSSFSSGGGSSGGSFGGGSSGGGGAGRSW